MEAVRSLLTNWFIIKKKKKFIRTELLPWIILVLTRCPSRDCFLDDISQLKIMEITKYMVVWEFTQVQGLEAQGP